MMFLLLLCAVNWLCLLLTGAESGVLLLWICVEYDIVSWYHRHLHRESVFHLQLAPHHCVWVFHIFDAHIQQISPGSAREEKSARRDAHKVVRWPDWRHHGHVVRVAEGSACIARGVEPVRFVYVSLFPCCLIGITLYGCVLQKEPERYYGAFCC